MFPFLILKRLIVKNNCYYSSVNILKIWRFIFGIFVEIQLMIAFKRQFINFLISKAYSQMSADLEEGAWLL